MRRVGSGFPGEAGATGRVAAQKWALQRNSLRYRWNEKVDFRSYAAQPDADLDLLEGALLVARDARPALDRETVERELDELAAPLARRQLGGLPAAAQARALADQLFVRAGFRGNTSDYYDPRNSFLDEVLARRTGIPISLSVLYVEVAKRAGVRASPVGFPGHFLACIDAVDGSRLVVDPFHGGGVRTEDSLGELLRRSGSNLEYSEELVAPTPVRQVVSRMLMNLRGIYTMRGDYARLLVVFDRLLDLWPNSVEELRDRGFLFARLGAPDAALADLARYLERSPNAADAAEVRAWLNRIEESTRLAPSRS
jgi:regulator of sirC expression with transglutaminase-like and TPR domain